MKKTWLLKSLVVICIILSFFSSIYAATAQRFSLESNNVTHVYENEDAMTTTITATASYSSNKTGTFIFSPNETGVYTIDVSGVSGYDGEDLYYTITDMSGKEVRLAAYYDATEEKYFTYTNGNDAKSTQIDVLLTAGKRYQINLSKKSAAPGASETYVNNSAENPLSEGNYQVKIAINTNANSRQVYQSNVSAIEITEDGVTDSSKLESVISDEYRIPSGSNFSFDNYDTLDQIADSTVGQAITYLPNAFEETICEIMLGVGDFVVNLMNTIIGEEVTITGLVYNQIDAVNANFFDDSVAATGITANITGAVSDWYNIFKMIAIAIYLIALLGIGINILLASTGNGMTKAKEMLISWVKGLAYLVIIPYFVKYAFLLNEALVDMLRQAADVPEYQIGSSFAGDSEWSVEEIEFRSPEYVSEYTGSVAFGSDEATQSYIKKVSSYEQNLDLMRIMRAYAGATKKFIYAVIWWILIGQLMSFIFQYYKRYFMLAFLIGMFPIVSIFHGIRTARGESGNEIGTWMKEVFTNIFMQLIQAIIYTIITGICISIVKEDIQSSANLNWLIIILAINFVSEGENLLRKIMGAMGNTAGGTGKGGGAIRGAYQKAKGGIQQIVGGKNK